MNLIKYLIVDDEDWCVSELTAILNKRYHHYKCVGIAKTIEEARQLFISTEPDIVFCDIMLGKNKIFEVLNPVLVSKFRIIFITGYEEYIVQALRLSAIDYFLKPVIEAELFEALDRFNTSKIKENDFEERIKALEYNLDNVNKLKKIGIASKDGYIFRSIDKLVFIEGKSNYSKLVFADGSTYTIAKTLLSQEEVLDRFGFLRIHQSYLVNLSYIEAYNINENLLLLPDAVALPVSIRRKNLLLEKIKSII